MTTVPNASLHWLHAPPQWQTVDFISDLHLHAADEPTFEAFQSFLNRPRNHRADALFILGDLFEVWVGDDAIDDSDLFLNRCVTSLREFSTATPVFFLCGNRDFLLGDLAQQRFGMQALRDPTALVMHNRHWLLSHGDELCLDDQDYQQFRRMVRSPEWRAEFLTRPLSERKAVALDMRRRSEARKKSMAHDPELWADVDPQAARSWLEAASADTLIHGHTHRPGSHDLGHGLRRVVLSDWDAQAKPPRLEALRLAAGGLERLPLA